MALEFQNAANERVNLGTPNIARNVTGASLCAWVRPLDVLDAYAVRFTGGTAGPRLTLYFNSANRIVGYGRRLDAGPTETILTNMFYAANTTYHVVIECQYDNQIIAVHVDGQLDRSIGAASFTGATSNTASISAYLSNSAGGMSMILDDVRVYERVLSQNEIATIYEARGRDRIVDWAARWKLLEESPGTAAVGIDVVKDTGPRAIHGTPGNSPIYRAALVQAQHSRRR